MTASMPIVSAGSTSTTVLPDLLEPQLCTLVERPPGSADWLHELKYDGWRLLARKDGDNVRLYTRGGVEWSQRLPRLVDAVRQLTVTSAWLDGEIVHLDDAGFPDFERLQHDMRVGDERRLIFQTFDLLWINGSDVTRRPLLERKARLREVIGGSDPRIRFTEHVVGDGADVFAHANALDVEGIVSKRADSLYHPGIRSREWQKAKCWRTHTVIVGGVQFDRDGHLEGLLVGMPVEAGLRFEGCVEFGLTRVRNLGQRLVELATTDSPFLGDWKVSDRRFWVRPDTTIEIRALPRRPGRLLRHATVMSIRECACGRV